MVALFLCRDHRRIADGVALRAPIRRQDVGDACAGGRDLCARVATRRDQVAAARLMPCCMARRIHNSASTTAERLPAACEPIAASSPSGSSRRPTMGGLTRQPCSVNAAANSARLLESNAAGRSSPRAGASLPAIRARPGCRVDPAQCRSSGARFRGRVPLGNSPRVISRRPLRIVSRARPAGSRDQHVATVANSQRLARRPPAPTAFVRPRAPARRTSQQLQLVASTSLSRLTRAVWLGTS